MNVDFPDGVSRRFHEPYRQKLDQAYQRYQFHRTAENRVEYRKALKAFADLVLRYETPSESELPPLDGTIPRVAFGTGLVKVRLGA